MREENHYVLMSAIFSHLHHVSLVLALQMIFCQFKKRNNEARVQKTISFVIAFSMAHPVMAETVSTRSRMALFQSQLSVLDDRASQQYANSVRLQPPRVIVPGTADALPAYEGTYQGPLLTPARAAARRHDIPEDLFLRLITQESGWNPNARSPKGALGLAQLMPATAQSLGVNPHDVAQNLEGGARYLRTQYDRFGEWRLALAAYNAGPEAVKKYGGIPPYAETEHYVKVILAQ
jgi:soluble lytic murein transglycosylase-like protein